MENELSLNGAMIDTIKILNEIGNITNRIINKPTTLGRVFPCSYYLDKNRIRTLYSIVESKINTLTNSLVEFEISIFYDDKTNIPYKSIDSFINDIETKQILPQSLKLKWTTNIFFPNQENILMQAIGERHDIEITFVLAPLTDEGEAYYFFNDYPIKGLGVIDVSIAHSNKIWAIEIMNHIADFIGTIKIKHNNFLSFLFDKKRRIGQISEKLINLSTLIPIILLLINYKTLNDNSILFLSVFSAFLFIICNIISYPIGKWIYNLLSKLKQKSYIDISDYSHNLYENDKTKKSIIFIIFSAILLPIVVNIISLLICKKIGF